MDKTLLSLLAVLCAGTAFATNTNAPVVSTKMPSQAQVEKQQWYFFPVEENFERGEKIVCGDHSGELTIVNSFAWRRVGNYLVFNGKNKDVAFHLSSCQPLE